MVENCCDPPLLGEGREENFRSEKLPPIDMLHRGTMKVPLHRAECHNQTVPKVTFVDNLRKRHYTKDVLVNDRYIGLSPFVDTQ